MGGGFAVLGGLLLWRHRNAAAVVAFALGGLLLLLAAFFPSGLAAPHRVWLAFARILARVNSATFLFLTFFFVITPLGLILRLLGRDELRRRGAPPPSMWSPYPERNRDPRHYETIW